MRDRSPVEAVEAALEAVEAALAAVAAREDEIHAWVYLDADRARDEARRSPPGPLSGLTVGVKDIFDTGDQPTEYGSPIYAGYRPRSDAAVVAALRAAGAVVLGKTVTAELAWVTPGPTTNPHRVTHTPGGSSSGSAAAVAAEMVDLALGTQTAGSVIRPASFCGVFGLKPTFGLLPTAGVKLIAGSLDTVGLLARELDVLEAAWSALTAGPGGPSDREPAPAQATFVLVRTDLWNRAEGDCKQVVEHAAAAAGATEAGLPDEIVGAADTAVGIQCYEGARSLGWELATNRALLSNELVDLVEQGRRIAYANYVDARNRASMARRSMHALFEHGDVLLTPAAVGEAPRGLDSTGAPTFNRVWTLLGLPTLTVPYGRGATGLPIGVQLVARPYEEWRLLAAARTLLQARSF